jgi:hypothetical protein
VLPKLYYEFQGACRYLARPFPDGPNPYLDAVNHNISIIEDRLSHDLVRN